MINVAARATGFGPIRPARYAAPPDFGIVDPGEALDEAEVSEFASRLLKASNDPERDHLLAAILIEGSGGGLSRPIGAALGGILKGLERPSLSRRAPARKALESELEGLFDHELEFEAPRRFVRLASEAARNAAEDIAMGHPHLFRDRPWRRPPRFMRPACREASWLLQTPGPQRASKRGAPPLCAR